MITKKTEKTEKTEKVKETFIMYDEFEIYFNSLSDIEVAMVMRALFAYRNRSEIPKLPAAPQIVFDVICNSINRNEALYIERCNVNRENGKKGGRPRKHKENEEINSCNTTENNPNKPNGFSKTLYDSDNDNENDNKNDNDICPPIPPKGGSDTHTLESDFSKFKAAYPNKTAMAEAEAVWRKLSPKGELVEKILHAIEVAKKKDFRFFDPKYTPNPATWLKGRQWENEFSESVKFSADKSSVQPHRDYTDDEYESIGRMLTTRR